MSKAFTKESDTEANDPLPVPRRRPPPGVTNYITASGAQRLREELTALLEQKRRFAEMAAPAVPALESDRRKALSRISEIEQILESVVVANPPTDAERVAFGALVTVRHASGEQVSYRIVGMDESAPDLNHISWLSPLAGHLMKRRTGDRFRFRSPAGEEELEIIAVQYPP